MDVDIAERLVGEEGAAALAMAARQADPSSLAAATAMRAEVEPSLAAAALTQVALRRRAVSKFGDLAAGMFFTPDALEQATRPEVSLWRARRLRAAGVTSIVDLGCGIGADAMAFVAEGVSVRAVELDPATAVLARANLSGVEVVCGDATAVAYDEGEAIFVDPARRTARGRTWRVEDVSPPWEFVLTLVAERTGCVKLGPGVPTSMLPPEVGVSWVSHRGDVVETSLWGGVAGEPGRREAVLLPAVDVLVPSGSRAGVGMVGSYVYEPDGAVSRAGGVDDVAALVDGWRLAEGIAYVSADTLAVTPFARVFEVIEVVPFKDKTVARWLHDHHIGTVEIKKRGVDLDPAQVRRRWKPRGPGSITVIISPSPAGVAAIMARRVG